MYETLIAALRDMSKMGMKYGMAVVTMREAADAIEELSHDYEKLAEDFNGAVELLHKRSKPRWIPVKERLPIGGDDSGALCENVCLLMDDGTVSCGWMNGITKKVYYLNARDDVIIKAPITRVTHWMPLPSTEGLNET